VRLACWITSYSYRKRYQRMVEAGSNGLLRNVPDSGDTVTLEDGTERYYGRLRVDVKGRRSFAKAESMREYFNTLRNGFIAAMLGRAAIIFVIVYLWKVRRARR
jgi:hypothetical protein